MSESQSQTNNTQQENQAVFYQIESGIPFTHTNTKRFKILAESMALNDSVLLQTDQERKSLITALKYQQKLGRSRQTNQGFRVWRIR
jgi:hypothetical protein